MKKMKLICLPYAGGNKYSYRALEPFIKDTFDMITVELPGRSTRISEPSLDNVADIIEDVLEQIKDHLFDGYILYGHSMGTLIGTVLLYELKERKLPLPQHAVFTGRGAPQKSKSSKQRHLLQGEEFKEELIKIGGCPDELLENEELMNFFSPIIRADFKAMETFSFEVKEKIDVPMTIIVGDEEDISDEKLYAWEELCSVGISIFKLPGNHFFIHEHYKSLAKLFKTTGISKTELL